MLERWLGRKSAEIMRMTIANNLVIFKDKFAMFRRKPTRRRCRIVERSAKAAGNILTFRVDAKFFSNLLFYPHNLLRVIPRADLGQNAEKAHANREQFFRHLKISSLALRYKTAI